MFQEFLPSLLGSSPALVTRDCGVAFLMRAKQIYDLQCIEYLAINIPRRGAYVHCAFGDTFAAEAISNRQLNESIPAFLEDASSRAPERTTFRLEAKGGGSEAWLAYEAIAKVDEEEPAAIQAAEVKILGTYFHNHILRRHGNNTNEALLVSARELDCLRWVAVGKSAWEASVILGISERTVRFHLNSAREKLNCTTTTQAVAKVVAQQLISV